MVRGIALPKFDMVRYPGYDFSDDLDLSIDRLTDARSTTHALIAHTRTISDHTPPDALDGIVTTHLSRLTADLEQVRTLSDLLVHISLESQGRCGCPGMERQL